MWSGIQTMDNDSFFEETVIKLSGSTLEFILSELRSVIDAYQRICWKSRDIYGNSRRPRLYDVLLKLWKAEYSVRISYEQLV